MSSDQIYFPGMEPQPQPKRRPAPHSDLRSAVKNLEDRVFALEVEITVTKALGKQERREF